MEIKDKVGNLVYKPLSSLKAFQGGLKELPPEEYEKLKNSFLANGNIAPFYVWKDNLLDGHQRLYTLSKLQEAGVEMPEKYPCVEIQATSLKQAKKYVLLYVSQHGVISKQGLSDYLREADLWDELIDLKEELVLPGINLEEFEEGYLIDEPATEKEGDEEAEPKNECPECGHRW